MLTATVTALPSWTALPTLADQNGFLDFIAFTENSICKFPCWAGIVPGKTNWDAAVFALRPMQSVAKLEILTDEESIYGKANAIFWYLYGGEFRVDGTFLTGSNVSLTRMSIESFSEPTATNPSHSLSLPRRFNMQSVLKEYGVPSMVFIYTFIHDQPGPLPFKVLLVYPENHFHIKYHRDAKLSGNTVMACDSDFYLEVTVVDDRDKLVSADIIAKTPETKSLGIENWKPVEQVLMITPEKFYEIYSTSDPGCMIFPTNNWLP
jgi:hypothetical protein